MHKPNELTCTCPHCGRQHVVEFFITNLKTTYAPTDPVIVEELPPDTRNCERCAKYIKPRWDCPDCHGTGVSTT